MSYLDPVAILPVCPAIPVAKGDVVGWPGIGGVGRSLGVVFVDRERPAHRVRALRRIALIAVRGAGGPAARG